MKSVYSCLLLLLVPVLAFFPEPDGGVSAPAGPDSIQVPIAEAQDPVEEDSPSTKFGSILVEAANPFVTAPFQAGFSFNASSGAQPNGHPGHGNGYSKTLSVEKPDTEKGSPSTKFGTILVEANPFVTAPFQAAFSFNASSGAQPNGHPGHGNGYSKSLSVEKSETDSNEEDGDASKQASVPSNANPSTASDLTTGLKSIEPKSSNSNHGPNQDAEKKLGVILVNTTQPFMFNPATSEFSFNTSGIPVTKSGDYTPGPTGPEVCSRLCAKRDRSYAYVGANLNCYCYCPYPDCGSGGGYGYSYGVSDGYFPPPTTTTTEEPCCKKKSCSDDCIYAGFPGGECDKDTELCNCYCGPCDDAPTCPPERGN